MRPTHDNSAASLFLSSCQLQSLCHKLDDWGCDISLKKVNDAAGTTLAVLHTFYRL
jgi:hypothetical protein